MINDITVYKENLRRASACENHGKLAAVGPRELESSPDFNCRILSAMLLPILQTRLANGLSERSAGRPTKRVQ
jgi:hypothetical protein